MGTVTNLSTANQDDPHWQDRVDLAAAFRLAVRNNWHEATANHFSLAVSDDGKKFLMNPNLKHWSRIKASDLLLIDADDPMTMQRPDAPDATAWGLHGSLHRNCKQARCALHVHPTYSTVLASLADSSMPPIDQNTARFFNRIVVDAGFDGMAFEKEGERCSRLFEDKKVMVMGNHGVMILGDTVAEAFDTLYYFERAATTLILAYSTGQKLRVLSDEVAEKTARAWEGYGAQAYEPHLNELKAILDVEEPDYAT